MNADINAPYYLEYVDCDGRRRKDFLYNKSELQNKVPSDYKYYALFDNTKWNFSEPDAVICWDGDGEFIANAVSDTKTKESIKNELVRKRKPLFDKNSDVESVYSMDDWTRDGTLSLKIGQLIDDDVYYELRDALPPQYHSKGYFQVGEPYDYDFDNRYDLYDTFEHTENGWKYVGLSPDIATYGFVPSKKKRSINESSSSELNKIITNLYKVSNKYGSVYRDDNWHTVRNLFDELSDVPGVEVFDITGTDYFNYFGNEPGYKEWRIFVTTPAGMIEGAIHANSAGRVDDKFSSYDITSQFWKKRD